MRIKINFKPCDKLFCNSTQHYVNGFIHELLGKDNKYHNSFSAYAVSSLQGGKLINGKLSYENGAYIYVSSLDNSEFQMDLMTGIISNNGGNVSELVCNCINQCDFNVHKKYDIIRTISPILIKDNNRFITFNDEDFIKTLTEKSKQKLLHNGISSDKVETLVIEPFHFENAKLKFVKVRNVVSVSSQVMLLIKGDPIMRKSLYEMGFGKSTGCGFGSVEIIDKNLKS